MITKKPRRYFGLLFLMEANYEFQKAKDDYGKMDAWIKKWNIVWVAEEDLPLIQVSRKKEGK